MRELPQELIKQFVDNNADILEAFGYPSDGSVEIPKQRNDRIKRPIRYTRESHENISILVESDFLGCNLLRFRKRFYAIPQSSGPIDISTLPQSVLDNLPSARSLNELRASLMLGPSQAGQLKQDLLKIGVREGSQHGATPRAWNAMSSISALEAKLEQEQTRIKQEQDQLIQEKLEFEQVRAELAREISNLKKQQYALSCEIDDLKEILPWPSGRAVGLDGRRRVLAPQD
jgi:hypothetical protein